MIAVRVHRYGGPEQLQLEEIGAPGTAENEALVRICAAGVGPWDALVRAGRSSLTEVLPLTPGADIAGIVEDVADGASELKRGDAVFGSTNPSFTGGYAQYAAASLDSITLKPDSLSFADAASVPVVACTAWQMLFDHAEVTAGQTVLVQGAAGNVGAYTVQLARWAGTRVIAVAAARDGEYLKSLGAAEVIDFQTEHFEDRVTDADVAIDTVGGNVQERSFRVLKPGGIIVSSVSPPSIDLAHVYGVRNAFFIVRVTSPTLQRIAQLIDDRTVQTDLGIVLGLADARKAHEMLAGTLPRPRGKIVLDTTISGNRQ
ncbi:MAG: NADP-dependent oxidoreductase [Candidatus Eremiobacteraeota bacterium]|nr:NADP-dependent oxidoreductase [Candidatus Eremiobacteraeota bacterium]